MGRFLIGSALVAALIGAVTFQLGLFDRPPFEETTLTREVYLLLASTTSKDIGGNVMRLLEGTKNAIMTLENADVLLSSAAESYNGGHANDLAGSLYFDNPSTTENPRWGMGWAIGGVENMEMFIEIQRQVQKASTLEEPIRAVKLGGPHNKVLKARIPWRNMLTPMLGAMIQWNRAFEAYKIGGYVSNSGREGDSGAIACEMYLAGPNHTMRYIDYVLLMGDTHEIFDQMFPSPPVQVDEPEKKEPAEDVIETAVEMEEPDTTLPAEEVSEDRAEDTDGDATAEA